MGEVVPCGTLDLPGESGDGRGFEPLLFRIAFHLHQQPDIVIRQVFVVVQAKARIGRKTWMVLVPITPPGANVCANTSILHEQALELGMGILLDVHAPANRCILRCRHPLRTAANELTVAYRHCPHGAHNAPVDRVDDDARLGIGDAICWVDRSVGPTAHEVTANQGVQCVITFPRYIPYVIEGGKEIALHLFHPEGVE